ncbi:MAG: M23 family metallopeptidase [Bacillota bacterium]
MPKPEPNPRHSRPWLLFAALVVLVGLGLGGFWAAAAMEPSGSPSMAGYDQLDDLGPSPGAAALSQGDEASDATTDAVASEQECEAGEETSTPLVVTYVVKSGDTLWDIAIAHQTTITSVKYNNGLSSNTLRPGQELKILTIDGLLYKVKSGDTLSGIASRFDTSISKIEEANGIDRTSLLAIGTQLILPDATPPRQVTVKTASTGAGRGQTATVTGNYIWPVRGRITSPYGWRWGTIHTGIDIAAPTGTSVKAARAGQVTHSGWLGNYGYTVVIDHGGGMSTVYAHNSALLVSAGQWVEQGTVVARVGSTGRSTGPHLHFEIRVSGRPIDPRPHLP